MIKKRAVVFDLVIFALTIVGLTVAPSVFAQAVPADLCVRLTLNVDDEGPISPVERYTMIMHLDTNDGVHFTVWGKVKIPKEPVHAGGTAILEGNILTINLTATEKHLDGWREMDTVQLRYNISTKTGTMYGVGHDFDVAGRRFDEAYISGTLRQCL